MLKWLLIFLCSSLKLLSLEPLYTFDPPTKWQLTDPKHLSQNVLISFIYPDYKPIRPSMNLSMEKVDIDLQTYIEKVKKVHLADRKNSWTSLGNINTITGTSHLSQIDIKAPQGDLRLFQAITIYQGYAVIMTALARKEEFEGFQHDFIKSFSSLQLGVFPEDLMASTQEREFLQKQTLILKTTWQKFLLENKLHSDLDSLLASKDFKKIGWIPLEKALKKRFPHQSAAFSACFFKFLRMQLLENSLSQESLSP